MTRERFLLMAVALVCGIYFFSSDSNKEAPESVEEVKVEGSASNAKIIESRPLPQTSDTEDYSAELNLPSIDREARSAPDVAARARQAPRTPSPEDSHLNQVQKSLREYDDEAFAESYMDDEALLRNFPDGKGPAVGHRLNGTEPNSAFLNDEEGESDRGNWKNPDQDDDDPSVLTR